MVNLITAKLESNSLANYQIAKDNVVQTQTLPTNQKPKTKSSKINNITKTVLPLSLITGGGLLIYYGLRKPSPTKIFNQLVKERFVKIEKYINDFSILNKKTVDEAFKNTDAIVEEYKKTHLINTSNYIQRINNTQTPTETINTHNNTFKSIEIIQQEQQHFGASDFDQFTGNLTNIKNDTNAKLDYERYQTEIHAKDLTHLPVFKDGSHADLVEASESQLISLLSSGSNEMQRLQKNKINTIINRKTRKFANAITEYRNNIKQTKQLIIDTTFNKIRSLLNLPEDFTPSYTKPKTLDNFNKLSSEDLKPNTTLNELNKVFEGSAIWNIIKTQDFTNISPNKLREFLYMLPPYENLSDINIMIDRIRLKNEVDKSLGINNDKINNNIIAKLEYLSCKLNELGEKELMKLCNNDFKNISIEQRKANLYYIYKLARKLGFSSIEQMDDFYTKNNTAYKDLSIHNYMDVIKEHPEYYFM